MQIFLSQYMGMCKGLRLILHRTTREIEKARVAGDEVYIFRELVHNTQANAQLLELGVKGHLYQIEDVPNDVRVIVGPHSASPSVLADLAKRATLTDTSCRDVLKVVDVAKSLSNEGYRIVFIGRPDHEEAEMIRNALPNTLLVHTESDIAQLPRDEPLGLVSQSTQTLERYMQLAGAIASSGYSTKVGMTVCQETHRRQQAVIELAKRVDKVIIIGGRHSHNTTSLADTARRIAPTWHIETPEELQVAWFESKDRIGVTAGASTPDFVINAVVERLNQISGLHTRKCEQFRNRLRWAIAETNTAIVDKGLKIVEFLRFLRRQGPTGNSNER